ncbi:MAG: right-handed parallel beta-helix repeat-containing protein [Agarilytica sp.]
MKIKATRYFIITAVLSLFVVNTAYAKGKKATVLMESDFKYGTYIIDKPGRYKLGEDITFNPNSPATLTQAVQSGMIPSHLAKKLELSIPVDAYHAGFPLFTQFAHNGGGHFSPGGPLDARYDPAGFGLGFFAAIVIQANGVVLDLNGHTIEQSEEHALLQRFFSVIELAEQPFIPAQGPADFGNEIIAAKNVVIKNGVIGRSSHHGIHGNNNVNVRIKNVDFVDFEVGAIALNGVDGLIVKNSNAENRKDVPVVGTYSSAQFIKPYIQELQRHQSTTELMVNGQTLGVNDIKMALQEAVNNVHKDLIVERYTENGRPVINKALHPEEFALFHNKFGVVDGNSYSYLVNKVGIAVNGFPKKPDSYKNGSRNVWFNNVHVENQVAFINEIVALNQGGPVIDPVGAVFQTQNVHPDTGVPVTISSLDKNNARYLGNAVANAQAFVAKASINGEFDDSVLDLKRLSINDTVLNWVEAKPGFENLVSIVPTESDFLCNGDSMFHVNKGVIAFKMDAVKNIVMRNTSATNVVNMGKQGALVCGDYTKSHPAATLEGYGGAHTRAYTFSGSKNVILAKTTAMELQSYAGNAVGVDVMTDTTNAKVKDLYVLGAEAGLQDGSVFEGPNETPMAIGFHIGEEAKQVKGKSICADLMEGFGGELVVQDESDAAFLKNICSL